MSELSNALRHRLASREEPRVHPDADTLTAYLEQLLPVRERGQVLEHLAICGPCREVIALSLSEPLVLKDAPVTAAPAGRGWRALILRKPALGLAASLAGLALVAAVIIEMPRRAMENHRAQTNQPAPAISESHPGPAFSPPASETITAPTSGISANAALPGTETRGGTAAAKSLSIPPVQPARVGASPPPVSNPGVSGPYINVQMFANDSDNAVATAAELPAAPSPQPTAKEASALSRSTPLGFAGPTRDLQQSRGKPVRTGAPTPSTGHFPFSMVTAMGHEAKQAKQLFHRQVPLFPGNLFADSAMGKAGQFNPTRELGAAPEVATAAAAGRDATDLDQSRAFTPPALAGSYKASVPTAWKIGDGKLLRLGASGAWTEAHSGFEDIEFSVVSSRGSEVWAGGRNAALVHSRDGGANWDRILLGASANGTITTIEAGATKVLVRSSSGQSWSSSDGGRSWVLED